MTKRFAVGFAILFGFASLHAQKTRWGQQWPDAKPGVNYPISVHVYGLHLRDCGEGVCASILYADVAASGRKLELECVSNIPHNPAPLSFGDFRGRLLKGASGFHLGEQYELLSRDRVFQCSVSGMME